MNILRKFSHKMITVFLAIATMVGSSQLSAMDTLPEEDGRSFHFKTDKNGYTVFMHLCIDDKLRVVKQILNAVDDRAIELISMQNKDGQTILHMKVAQLAGLQDSEDSSDFNDAVNTFNFILNAVADCVDATKDNHAMYQQAFKLFAIKDTKGKTVFDAAKEAKFDEICSALHDDEMYYRLKMPYSETDFHPDEKGFEEDERYYWCNMPQMPSWFDQDEDGYTSFMNVCNAKELSSIDAIESSVDVILSSVGQDIVKLLKIVTPFDTRTVLHQMVLKIGGYHCSGKTFVEKNGKDLFVEVPANTIGKHHCGELISLRNVGSFDGAAVYKHNPSRPAYSSQFILLGKHCCGQPVLMAILRALSRYVCLFDDCPDRYQQALELLTMKDKDGSTALRIARCEGLEEIACILEMYEKNYRSKIKKGA